MSFQMHTAYNIMICDGYVNNIVANLHVLLHTTQTQVVANFTSQSV